MYNNSVSPPLSTSAPTHHHFYCPPPFPNDGRPMPIPLSLSTLLLLWLRSASCSFLQSRRLCALFWGRVRAGLALALCLALSSLRLKDRVFVTLSLSSSKTWTSRGTILSTLSIPHRYPTMFHAYYLSMKSENRTQLIDAIAINIAIMVVRWRSQSCRHYEKYQAGSREKK